MYWTAKRAYYNKIRNNIHDGETGVLCVGRTSDDQKASRGGVKIHARDAQERLRKKKEKEGADDFWAAAQSVQGAVFSPQPFRLRLLFNKNIIRVCIENRHSRRRLG